MHRARRAYVVSQSSSNKYLCLVPNILECFHHVTIRKMLVSVWSYLQCQHCEAEAEQLGLYNETSSQFSKEERNKEKC